MPRASSVALRKCTRAPTVFRLCLLPAAVKEGMGPGALTVEKECITRAQHLLDFPGGRLSG